MRETWNAARVGLLLVAGVVATLAVYRYVDERAGTRDGYTVYALFDDVQGLIPKSRVVIAGIPVGYIDSIGLVGEKAKVTIHLDPKAVLYRDASIEMRAVSLLGEQVLVIHPGTPDLPRLADGDRIATVVPSVSTGQVLSTVNDIAVRVKSVATQLERAFGTDEAGDQLKQSLRDLSETLATVRETVQRNQENVNVALENIALATKEGTPRVLKILQNVQETTNRLNHLIATRQADIDDTIQAIHHSSKELQAVLGDVHEISARTARGEGTLGRLTKDDTLIDEVQGAAAGVNSLVGGYSRLQTYVGLRSEYNFLANTLKTYFTLKLQPREDRYFFLQVIDDPRGVISVQDSAIYRSPPDDGDRPFQLETRITRKAALKFSLMFAKRIAFATFRFGILESTGGIGLDLHLLDDRLELNADMFDFGIETFPRARIRTSFEVVNRLWLSAGMDDFLNWHDHDFFFGLMLRFNDEDLKGLLPFAGGIARP